MQSTKPIFKIGSLRYQRIAEWPSIAGKINWGITHGVAVDSEDRIYITHTGEDGNEQSDTVIVFDSGGTKTGSLGECCYGSAHGIEITTEGSNEFIYLTDLKRGLFKLTLTGELVWHFEKPRLYQEAFGLNWSPSNIAVTEDSDIYLSDGYGSAFIVQIDKATGEEIRTFGGPGFEKHHLFHPHGLAIDSISSPKRLVVADNIHNRFVRYDLNGHYLDEALVDDPELIAPRHIVWNENMMVVPDLGGQILFYDPDFKLVGSIGAPELPFEDQVKFHEQRETDCPPHLFRLPHDLAFDKSGNLYIVEWIRGGRVSKIQRLP